MNIVKLKKDLQDKKIPFLMLFENFCKKYHIDYTKKNNMLYLKSFYKEEKTPSLIINGSKELYKDFSITNNTFSGNNFFDFLKNLNENNFVFNQKLNQQELFNILCECSDGLISENDFEKYDDKKENTNQMLNQLKEVVENNNGIFNKQLYELLAQKYSYKLLNSFNLDYLVKENKKTKLFFYTDINNQINGIDFKFEKSDKWLPLLINNYQFNNTKTYSIKTNNQNDTVLNIVDNVDEFNKNKNNNVLLLQKSNKEHNFDFIKETGFQVINLSNEFYNNHILEKDGWFDKEKFIKTCNQNLVLVKQLKQTFNLNKVITKENVNQNDIEINFDNINSPIQKLTYNNYQQQRIDILNKLQTELANPTNRETHNQKKFIDYMFKRGFSEDDLKNTNIGFINNSIIMKLFGIESVFDKNNNLIEIKYNKKNNKFNYTDLIKVNFLFNKPNDFKTSFINNQNKKIEYTSKVFNLEQVNQLIKDKQILDNNVIVPIENFDNKNPQFVVLEILADDCITIPCYDKNNNVNSYICRTIYKPEEFEKFKPNNTYRKYKYLKGWDNFNQSDAKSNNLFNINNIVKNQPICLVEGQFDALAISKLNYNAVALGGLSISEKQIELLKEKSNIIYLGLDNDIAGNNAVKQISEKLIENGFIVKILENKTKYKDYDEMIVLNNQKEEFNKIINNTEKSKSLNEIEFEKDLQKTFVEFYKNNQTNLDINNPFIYHHLSKFLLKHKQNLAIKDNQMFSYLINILKLSKNNGYQIDNVDTTQLKEIIYQLNIDNYKIYNQNKIYSLIKQIKQNSNQNQNLFSNLKF